MRRIKRRPWMPALGAVLAVGLALGLTACGSSSEVAEADDGFGQRIEEAGRETLLITPIDSVEAFFYYPATLSEIDIRAGAAGAEGRRPVELLIKGALPDGCTALHNIEQTRVGNIIEVTFEMRRPKGAVCTQVVRPYRFYYTLADPLAPGDYTLKVNDGVKPFTVFPPAEG